MNGFIQLTAQLAKTCLPNYSQVSQQVPTLTICWYSPQGWQKPSDKATTPNINFIWTEPHIAVTAEPVHVTPSHESPQGSPPLGTQPVSWDGEFRLVKRMLREEAAHGT